MKIVHFVSAITCLIGVTAVFADQLDQGQKDDRKAQMAAAMLRKTGGFIQKPDSAKGKILFVDSQDVLNSSNMMSVVALLQAQTRFDTHYVKEARRDISIIIDEHTPDAVIMAIDDTASPTLLVSPEDRWAVVNVSKLADGLKSENAKARFLPSRFRKELLRAFAFATGGTSSQFPGNIMQVSRVGELDVCPEALPQDTLSKAQTFMKKVGVSPAIRTTYRQACMQGWAPAPTNDIQQAIWDKTHEIPSEPIKIEFKQK